MTDIEKVNIITERVEQSHVDIAQTFDEYMLLCFALVTLGEAGRSFFHRLCSMSPKYSKEDCEKRFDYVLKANQGLVSIASFYYLCKQHGVDISMPKGRQPISEGKKQKSKGDKMREIKECEVWRPITREFGISMS